jgi:hypothetical protein
MAKQFGIPLKFDNKIDLAKSFLQIYMIAKPPQHTLVERAKEALAYFLVYGYSKEGEKSLTFSLSQQIKNSYVRVIINMLKNNGYLIIDPKTHKKRLSDELLNCQEQLFKKRNRIFTIGFIHTDE